jgi:dCTP deaminase
VDKNVTFELCFAEPKGVVFVSVLSDVRLIESIFDGKLIISPFVLAHVQPSSIDLTLDPLLKKPQEGAVVDLTEDNAKPFEEIGVVERYCLEPGKMLLGQTGETIGIPRSCTGHIHNRSSLARMGLDIASASYINPGYKGKLPIIIKNNGTFTVKLVPGIRICQLVVADVEPEPVRDYSQRKNSKYFDEKDSLVSLLHLDEEIQDFKEKKRSTEEEQRDLAQFLQDRIRERSNDILEEMRDETKRKLGIL